MRRNLVLLSSRALVVSALVLWGGPVSLGWAQERSSFEVELVQEEEFPSGTSEEVPVLSGGEPVSSEGEIVIPETSSEEGSDTDEVIRYTVKEGDTLWDITRSVWQDSFLWPKVWGNNRYIDNPDLIYPGNVLIFPAGPRDVEEIPPPPPAPVISKAPPPMPPPMIEEPPPPEVVPVPPAEPPPPPPPAKPKIDLSMLASSGYVIYGQKAIGSVIGTPDNRKLIGDNEVAYILPRSGVTLEMGDRLTVYRNIRKVYHPKTGKFIGSLVRILGVAEVSEDSEKVKQVDIVKIYHYITQGDSVILSESLDFAVGIAEKSLSEKGERTTPSGIKGYIIDVKDSHVSNAPFEIVYLDRGIADGLQAGDRFIVMREGDKVSRGVKLPRREIGRLEVLMVQDVTAAARVVNSTEVIYKGDQIETPPTP